MCNVLPAGALLPKHVPSYGVVRDGTPAETPNLDGLIDTARAVMARRDQSLSETRAGTVPAPPLADGDGTAAALREREQTRLRRTA